MPLVTFSVNRLWKKKEWALGQQLAGLVFQQARTPLFYEKWGVPDTLEGRFDCACLHLALLLRHLKGSLAQKTFDAFFSHLDLTLREMGVSDLRVGKQVKKCAKFFYGALKAYHEALDNNQGLKEALIRNLYGNATPASLDGLLSYVKRCDHLLKFENIKDKGAFEWPSLEKEE